MPSQQQDANSFGGSRQRANTTSFAQFGWRMLKPDPPVPYQTNSPQQAQQPLSLNALLDALKPPAVPSLAHARALAAALITASPLPQRSLITEILSSLCDVSGPLSFQAAGFDILAAYWENNEVGAAATADRLSFFSLFLGSDIPWAMEIWEPRFKAIRALTKDGTDIIGIETTLINIIRWWIEGAFTGLLKGDAEVERAERTERERSVDVLVKFLSEILGKSENIARLPDETIPATIQFYAELVDRSIIDSDESYASDMSMASPEALTSTSPPSQSRISRSLSHRRNPSALSASSLPSPIMSIPPSQYQLTYKHPAEIAITIYIEYLQSQIKTISPSILEAVLTLLFRSLAFFLSPLPRLTVLPTPRKKVTLEDRIIEMLDAIFSGPYSTTCMIILRHYIGPHFPVQGSDQAVETELSQPDIDTHTETTRPVPQIIPWEHLQLGTLSSYGALRMLRNYVRRTLISRLARAYISRETTMGYSHSGAPSHIDVGQDLMEKAWPKDEYPSNAGIGIGTINSGWDARRIGKVLSESVAAWVAWVGEGPHTCNMPQDKDVLREYWDRERQHADRILEEAAGLLKDILQEVDSRDDDQGLNDEEAALVGGTLYNLAAYVLSLRNPDGSPFIVPLENPASAPTPLLRLITSLLARDHTSNLHPLLSTILISIVDNLRDQDTARLPTIMLEQHDLSPTSPDWLANWENLFNNRTAISSQRPLTKIAALEVLAIVYDSVKDMTSYRRPLADLVFTFAKRWIGARESESEDGDTVWKVLSDELVLRAIEQKDDGEGEDEVEEIVSFLQTIASEPSVEEIEDMANTQSALSESLTPSPTPGAVLSTTPSSTSPILSRMQSELLSGGKEKERESAMPSVMSLLSSLTTGGVSRSQSAQQVAIEDEPEPPILEALALKPRPLTRVVCAVTAIVDACSQIAFTSHVLKDRLHHLAVRLYDVLVGILVQGQSARARVTALQFLMRLRADRDHNIYYIARSYDANNMIATLCSLISRSSLPSVNPSIQDPPSENSEARKARPRIPREKDDRQNSRGRMAGGLSRSTNSRSRSRVAAKSLAAVPQRVREPLWTHPEKLPFTIPETDTPSEALISYDPEGPGSRIVLPISHYLKAINDILERETSWEVLSYVLCHLPTQLTNKHLFCGPLCRQLVSRLLTVLCSGILTGELGFYVESWPPGLKIRDAQGLAYHTLSVLISYRKSIEPQQRHLLVEVFQHGLDGQLPTIICCLHALTLSAFELQSSVMKCMSRILEKLSQIMSNPNMSVHILGFLSIVGSLPVLYANFTDGDYKMVFGVALQYLQHYNRLNSSPTMSWALSQYVRVMSYSTVYIWFLALKLPDRPKHITYITRQLMLANEGNTILDGPSEVCFDWLARYTYASADPRPAVSAFSDIVMDPLNYPTESGPNEVLQPSKTWLVGNAVTTVRSLPRAGWVEVLIRRPSGFSKFICRVENVPMVGPGDVSPDISSVPAGLMLDRNKTRVVSATGESVGEVQKTADEEELQSALKLENDEHVSASRPDPITGYVWSKTAPSQRRKDVVVDPSYFALQMSSYPFGNSNVQKIAEDTPGLARFLSMLDRIPVIDTHKVGIMYVAPGQTDEYEILRNTHGSPAYTRFLEGLGRLINLRGQVDVYAGGLEPDEDGEYAYAWWDDIGQILYHTATMMPNHPHDPQCNFKKRHIGNDYVRIVWNDSGIPYQFDTLSTQFQFINIVIEPHSLGAIAAFSNNLHENEYFKVTVQRAPGMTEFAPIGNFKLISAENLPLLVRQLSLLADWFTLIFSQTQRDTARVEVQTNWWGRFQAIQRFKSQLPPVEKQELPEGIFSQEAERDFTNHF